MLEASEQKDRFYYMSPVERNNFFKSFFTLVPPEDVQDERYRNKIGESISLYDEERKMLQHYVSNFLIPFTTGEYITQSITNLRQLLTYSTITTPFKDHISLFIRNMLIFSVRPDLSSFFRTESDQLQDINFPQSPGIFDASIAREIEHTRFKHVRRDISTKGSIEIARMPQWRIEYWRKYKVDPRIDKYMAERI